MGRLGITFSDVANAIATLQGKQKNPTVDTIREELGTGSKSTIAKLLREWKAKNSIESRDEGAIPSELLSLVRGLWEKTQAAADTAVSEHQKEADAAISEINIKLSEAVNQNDLLSEKLALLKETLENKDKEAISLAGSLAQVKSEITALESKYIALNTQYQHQLTENNKLHQLLKNTQENLNHYQQSIERQRQEQQLQLEKDRTDYVQQLSTLQTELRKSSEEKSAIETKQHLIAEENNTLKSNVQLLEKGNKRLQISIGALSANNEHITAECKKYQNDAAKTTQLLNEKEKASNDLAIQIGILSIENDTLKQKIYTFENKIDLLQTEKNNLNQENIILKMKIEKETVRVLD